MSERVTLSQAQVYDVDRYIKDTMDLCWRHDTWSREVSGSTVTLPKEAVFQSLDDVQRYVDKLLVVPAIRAIKGAPVPRIEVRPSKYADSHYASRTGDAIYIIDTVADRREINVLHELAHCLSSGSHGDAFRAAYLELIELASGPELALLYRVKLDEYSREEGRYTTR